MSIGITAEGGLDEQGTHYGGKRVEGGELVASTNPPPHHCKLPQIITEADEPRTDLRRPPRLNVLLAGTRFICDCGKGYLVWNKPSTPGRINGPVWRAETRRERRKRERAAL